MTVQYVEVFCRVALFVVLAVSVVAKVGGRHALRELAGSLAAMRLVTQTRSRRAALLLVMAEVSTAALLAVPLVLGFAAAAVLMGMLTIGVAIAVRRGADVPCPCFGASAVPVRRVHVARNAGLFSVAVLGGTTALIGGTSEPAGLALSVAAGVVAGGLLVFLDEFVELFQPMSSGARG